MTGKAARDGGGALRPAVFLDRDGVINVDAGYTFRVEDLRFTPTAVEGIRLLNEAGYLAIVVTNQSGVARGLYGVADIERFHARMQDELARGGAHIDAFYHCAYHPDGTVAEFAREHEDRKPSPGMLLRAIRDLPVDRARSVMIGDRRSDMEVAARVGIPGILVTPDICDLAYEVRRVLAGDLPALASPAPLV